MSKHPHLHDNEVILDVRDLRVAYGKVEALHGVDLCIRRGQIVTVIGPNGAGKTTLLAALIGLLPATGDIIYMGHPSRHADEVETLVRQGMTLVPEKRELFAEMSVEDNLILGAFDRYRTGHRDQMETMDEVFELFPRLEERRSQLAGTLSGGERQMLAMGRALMAKPKLLMLDEPSLGLAPLIIKEIFRVEKNDARRAEQAEAGEQRLVVGGIGGDVGLQQREAGQPGLHAGSAKVKRSISLHETHQSA
jgi:branched-chain amino acid transport system ATP-binding protein